MTESGFPKFPNTTQINPSRSVTVTVLTSNYIVLLYYYVQLGKLLTSNYIVLLYYYVQLGKFDHSLNVVSQRFRKQSGEEREVKGRKSKK